MRLANHNARLFEDADSIVIVEYGEQSYEADVVVMKLAKIYSTASSLLERRKGGDDQRTEP